MAVTISDGSRATALMIADAPRPRPDCQALTLRWLLPMVTGVCPLVCPTFGIVVARGVECWAAGFV